MTVAVWAEHAKVLKPMVISHAVDVVDVNIQRAPPPLADTAFLASICEDSRGEQAPFHVLAASAARKQFC